MFQNNHCARQRHNKIHTGYVIAQMRARISDEQCKHYIFLKLLLRRRRHKKPSNFPFLKSNDDWIGRQRYSKKNCVLLNTKIAGDVRLQHSGYFNPRYHSRMRYNEITKQKKTEEEHWQQPLHTLKKMYSVK